MFDVEMEQKRMFLTATDGIKIAYDAQGEGPLLILLQGFDEARQIWHELGYVERLSQHFRVVTMDRRGIGESDKPTSVSAYRLEQMLADISAVADACEAQKFMVWGHSFGASLTLQLAARSERVSRAIAAGSFFGRVYFEERINQIVSELQVLYKAQQDGTLRELGLDNEDVRWVEERSLPALMACWQATVSWPIVNPGEVRCPLYVYSGSDDHRITKPLLQRQEEIDEASILLRIFDHIDHAQELSEIEVVYPAAEVFLRKQPQE
ncbi:alpha/beta fold hydrolase [Dictyobacter aurantiacus]|uniref:AB hydrolase-1 domain-containing protein n=1 Tax=Dictyobacter aurantiacus TaxID=1936993 RepID=A0A401ZJ98_9CHLR|nr:alpha/beta fold hydrolase [Dictyobacter aurantiacus]GCE06904.1 hypothetical protein KDAU_42330 [Dictyobacter aurantiacus]